MQLFILVYKISLTDKVFSQEKFFYGKLNLFDGSLLNPFLLEPATFAQSVFVTKH
jgi:hypothetical protein